MGKILDIQPQTNYVKLHYSLKGYPDRLNRTILIDADLSLIDLSYAMGASLGCDFMHESVFQTKENRYTCDYGLQDNYLVATTTIEDLGKSFDYIYDSDENWFFNCKVEKYDKPVDIEYYAIAIDGTGQGIWENNKYTLEAYFNGKISKDRKSNNVKMGYYKPRNFEIKKFGDFDAPLDLDLLTCWMNNAIVEDMYEIFNDYDDRDDEFEYDERDYPFDDESCDEDTDYFCNDDDDLNNPSSVDELICDFVSKSFLLHSTVNPFILEKLKELSTKHGEYKATEKVFDAYSRHIMNVVFGDEPYSSDQYRKKIENLK